MVKVTSPPFDTTKITSPRVYKLVNVGYCGISEYHYWLLSEREDFAEELNLSAGEKQRLVQAKTKFKNWRKEYAEAMKGSVEPGGVEIRESLIEALDQKMNRQLSRVLSLRKRERLVQLANQLMLSKTAPMRAMNSLPAYVRLEDQDTAVQLAKNMDEKQARALKDAFFTVRSELKESPRKLVVDWFSIGLKEEKLEWLNAELKLHHFRPVTAQEYSHIQDLDRHKSEIGKNLSLEDAWRRSSTITLAASGRYSLKIEDTKEDATKNLLNNCVYDTRFKSDLSVTVAQVKQAEQVLLKISEKNSKLDMRATLEEILLPHQFDALEERTVWRELELFGLLPCLLHGRLRDKLEIDDADRDEMVNAAKTLRQKLSRLDKEIWTKELEVWRNYFEQAGAAELFEQTFGAPPEKSLFPRTKIL